jgi:hypothetical protein
MKGYNGFTLIECTLYILFLGLISTMWFSSTIRIYTGMRSIYYKNHILLNLYASSDALVRDLRLKPPTSNALWYLPHGLVWHHTADKHSIGWFLQDHTLMRCEGIYNQEAHTWSECTKSVVCNAMTAAEFMAKESGSAVAISFVSGAVTMERTIWL